MPGNSTAPRLLRQPQTQRALQKGIATIADAVRPTLGPVSRTVLVGREAVDQPPALLDSGGLIARRIIALPNRDEDVGAMLLRDTLWRLHEQVGDGTTTAAVIFEAIYSGGARYLASGGNAMRLRRALEAALPALLSQLDAMSIPISGREMLGHLAESACHDPALGKLLGEIFDIIGQYGHLEIRTGRGRGLEREYIEGMYWDGGLLCRPSPAANPALQVRAENAATLIGDLPVETADDLIPALQRTLQAGTRALVIVTPRIADQAIALLRANAKPDVFQVLVVKTPGASSEAQAAALEDLAVLTGGRPLLKDAGASLQSVRWEDLGHARRAWADRFFFGVVGGKGSAIGLRRHIAGLRSVFANAPDAEARKAMQQRLGKLMGGAATLWVGGVSDREITMRKDEAERTANVLRGAVSDGVLPGGGIALLACGAALQACASSCDDPDERAARRILAGALEAPFRTLVANAGYDAGQALAQLDRSCLTHGFDVLAGKPVDMIEAGILESSAVVKAAARQAISSAALALTIDVLVHHARPEVATP